MVFVSTRMSIRLPLILVSALLAFGFSCDNQTKQSEQAQANSSPQAQPTAANSDSELDQTGKLLGVPVQKFPAPQELNAPDEMPNDAAPFKFTLTARPLSGPPPRGIYDERKIVKARAADGAVYEAYCGSNNGSEVVPGHGFVSTFENRRQEYGTHHGYGFMPQDVFIGKREGSKIKATLFFRDVGSHTTAPHYLAIDNQGKAHLALADVNTFQNNRLDLYWVIGDSKTGKWESAWLIDRRGFTSWSHTWNGAWADKVHLIWDWCDKSQNKNAPGMGAYHVEWSPNGFGRKTRIFGEPVNVTEGAFDPQSGLLVIVLVRDEGGVFVLSRSADGKWRRAVPLHASLTKSASVAIEPAGGAFKIRTSENFMEPSAKDTKEWLLQPSQ
jgi:hypothetical protein